MRSPAATSFTNDTEALRLNAGASSTAPASAGEGGMPYMAMPMRTRSNRVSGRMMAAAELAAWTTGGR